MEFYGFRFFFRRSRPRPRRPAWQRFLIKLFIWTFGLAFAAVVAVITVAGVAPVGRLSQSAGHQRPVDYRPKLPLRIYSAEGVLLGEFGEERRNLTPINEIPAVMKNAVLAIEDARFYSHSGVDYKG
jgi:penicillin-binding protein 1A